MAVHKVRKGLDLPISGNPRQELESGRVVSRVGITADDYPGMKPRMLVNEGDQVLRGQPLFENRRTPGVLFTAPGSGRVIGVNRGARRVLQSVVIHLSEAEQSGDESKVEHQKFTSFTGEDAEQLTRDQIVALLVESGLWTALRTRPFSSVPALDSVPYALFVNAMDSNPLAAEPALVIEPRKEAFRAGLQILSKLTDGDTFLCVQAGDMVSQWAPNSVKVEAFSGPHPSGTTGYHIHRLAPVSRKRTVWSIGYQDVLAVADLFQNGRLNVERVVSLAGPPLADPRLVNTRLGASVDEIVGDEVSVPACRLISGSVFSGKKAVGNIFGYLGRYDNQVSVLKEEKEREFLGWLKPGLDQYSVTRVFMSKLFKSKPFDFTTSTNGSPRAMVPIGLYERVMPLDIMPTFLLRALCVGDIEEAEKLGCLELDEEDLGLCTFVCPGKTNYGRLLRINLDIIEKEG
jgi:Na+-transporting NADH:ubiquinone oxidoreductase subunit A